MLVKAKRINRKSGLAQFLQPQNVMLRIGERAPTFRTVCFRQQTPKVSEKKSSKSGSAMGFDAGIQNNDWYFQTLELNRCCFRRSYPTTTPPHGSMPNPCYHVRTVAGD